MRKNKKVLDEDSVRVIKLSKDALLEFIYEQIVEKQEDYFDVDRLDVSSNFEINWENGEFIFCTYKSEDSNGDFISLPKEIDLQQLMKNMEDTTSTMYSPGRYKEYSKSELIELSKKL